MPTLAEWRHNIWESFGAAALSLELLADALDRNGIGDSARQQAKDAARRHWKDVGALCVSLGLPAPTTAGDDWFAHPLDVVQPMPPEWGAIIITGDPE